MRNASSLLVLLALCACSPTPRGDPNRCAIPVYEEVEVPVCERRPTPRHAIRFVPQYEEVVEQGPRGARRCRRFVGYEPEEVAIGCTWEQVETDRETIRVLRGWRWADDPPWPCECDAPFGD